MVHLVLWRADSPYYLESTAGHVKCGYTIIGDKTRGGTRPRRTLCNQEPRRRLPDYPPPRVCILLRDSAVCLPCCRQAQSTHLRFCANRTLSCSRVAPTRFFGVEGVRIRHSRARSSTGNALNQSLACCSTAAREARPAVLSAAAVLVRTLAMCSLLSITRDIWFCLVLFGSPRGAERLWQATGRDGGNEG